jgi:hypothetical protein
VGLGARLAIAAISFGTSSLASAGSLDRYETPLLGLLAPPGGVPDAGPQAGSNWSAFVYPKTRIRLSLGSDEAPKTGRPFRTTLEPPPPPRSPTLPPVPTPDDLLLDEPGPFAEGAPLEVSEPPLAEPLPPPAIDDPERRRIHLSLDPALVGPLEAEERGPPRPIRLHLGAQETPSSSPSRPFRSVLD